MAPINQIESRANGLPRSRARKPGVVKMPAPITFAMTIQVAKRGPAVRSRDVCRRSMDNVCRTGIRQSLNPNYFSRRLRGLRGWPVIRAIGGGCDVFGSSLFYFTVTV